MNCIYPFFKPRLSHKPIIQTLNPTDGVNKINFPFLSLHGDLERVTLVHC